MLAAKARNPGGEHAIVTNILLGYKGLPRTNTWVYTMKTILPLLTKQATLMRRLTY
jgi:hypothetical protein